jgi:hypothetical protein
MLSMPLREPDQCRSQICDAVLRNLCGVHRRRNATVTTQASEFLNEQRRLQEPLANVGRLSSAAELSDDFVYAILHGGCEAA